MPRTLSPALKSKSDERKARFRTLAKQIADMTDAQRAELAAKVVGLANIEGRSLSLYNSCFIASQCPTATIVGGFRQWLNAGRCVRKGETGLMIWVPIFKKSDNGQDAGTSDAKAKPDDTRFLIGTVFDVSQTDELPAVVEVA